MWWKWIIQIAVATGLDKWAASKVENLLKKGLAALTKKAQDLSAKTTPTPTTKAIASSLATLNAVHNA